MRSLLCERLFVVIVFLVTSMVNCFGDVRGGEGSDKVETYEGRGKGVESEGCCEGVKEDEKEKTLKIGNLSLRGSQRPGGLVVFGFRVIDQDELQLYFFADGSFGRDSYRTDIMGSLVYGVTDKLSILFNLPYSPANKDGFNESSGMEDLLFQLEYAYYSKERECSSEQATVVAAVSIPTGSANKNPSTGFGAVSYFVGATYGYTGIEWLYFGDLGIVLTEWDGSFRAGNELVYEIGFGRNICTRPGWIYAWIVEIIGQYTWKNKIEGIKDPNTGGSVISIMPSLWVSSERTILQIGVGTPIVQNLFGKQSKELVEMRFSFVWTF